MQLELKHQTMRSACTGCRHSKMSSRVNELAAVSNLRLWAAVGLLTGHTNLRVHLYELGHTERQKCRLCGYDRGQCTHCV